MLGLLFDSQIWIKTQLSLYHCEFIISDCVKRDLFFAIMLSIIFKDNYIILLCLKKILAHHISNNQVIIMCFEKCIPIQKMGKFNSFTILFKLSSAAKQSVSQVKMTCSQCATTTLRHTPETIWCMSWCERDLCLQAGNRVRALCPERNSGTRESRAVLCNMKRFSVLAQSEVANKHE